MGQVTGEFRGGVFGANAGSSNAGAQDGDVTQPILDQARDVASAVTSEAKEAVETNLMRRQEQSAMELTSIANVLREKSEEMEHSMLAPLIGGAADQMDRASEYMKDASLRDVLQSTESLARREPLLFLGGAFTLGLIAARFLRSSAHHADHANAGVNAGRSVQP